VSSVLHLPPDCLLVCVDDTGHEELAPGHVFYGLGGCAALMAHYPDLIDRPWRTVRQAILGDGNAPLHATKFGHMASPADFEVVTKFFSEQQFFRFAAAGSAKTSIPDDMDLAPCVIEMLKRRFVDVARYSPFSSVAIIFEENPRSKSLIERCFSDFRLKVDGSVIEPECYFMPKSANFPALEVADFIANAIGGHVRHSLVEKKPGFRKDFQAIFHSVDPRLVSFMGIETVEATAVPQAPAP
jgi:hypothetical protein